MGLLLTLSLFVAPAQAGMVSRFCSRYFVMDDPYVYEDDSMLKLISSFDAMCVARRWRPLSDVEAFHHLRMVRELQRRAVTWKDWDQKLARATLLDAGEEVPLDILDILRIIGVEPRT